MNQNLSQTLEALLRTDERIVSQSGELLKNRVQELVGADDPSLLELIYNNPVTRSQFFLVLKKTSIFEKEKFLQFVTAKEWLPDSYTAYKNKIGLTHSGGTFIGDSGEVILDWAFKDCILEGGMKEDEASRSEIFYNQTLAPDAVNRLLESKAFINAKRISKNGESSLKSFNFNDKGYICDNLIIRGNNLLGLSSIRDVFGRKVKLIYIDPPYNIGGANGTSADFPYNDRFNHSTWLTFMKNRVEIARKLLTEDGIMVIQCDDNELFHLKVLLDEVFKKSPKGKSNFVQMVEIRANEGAANEYQNPFMPKNCEYLLIYAKNYDVKKYKPIWIESHIDNAYSKILLNPEEKNFHKWKVGTVKEEYLKSAIPTKCDNPSCDPLTSDQYRQFIIKNASRIFRGIAPKGAGKGLSDAMLESKKSGGWSIYRREDNDDIYTYKGEMVRFYSKNLKKDQSGKTTITRELGSLWTDIPWTGIANEGGVKFKNGKKPEALLRRVIEMNSEPGDLVLDYHLGSGTTAAVAHKMKRQYIGIEQLNYGENDATQRLKNVIGGDKTGVSKATGWIGGGEFVYLELAERNPKLMERIEKATTVKHLLNLWDEVSDSPYVSHKIDLLKLKNSRSEFEQLPFTEAKDALLDILDKNAIYVNVSELEDKSNGLIQKDIALNKAFYGLS